MKPIPPISKYMTTQPLSIGKAQTLAEAQKLMQDNGIRHLPVLDGGVLQGVVTDRDLNLIQTLRGVDGKTDKVEEAMSQNAFSVSPDAPLDEVVTAMAEGKYGSAIVLHAGRLVGIFTTVDVCRALSDLLHTRMR